MEKRLNRSFMLRKTKVQLKMSKKRKKLKVLKAASGRDAGMGMGGKTGGGKSSGGGGGRDTDFQQRGMSKADYAKSKQSQNFGGRQDKTVTARKSPPQLPVIGPTTYLANKMIQGFYNAKNLKEQKKEDVLGGEMLTTGKRTTTTMTRDSDQGKDPMILPKVAVKPTFPIPLQKVTPRKFAFELKRGGLSGGVKSGPPPKRGPNPQGMKKGGMACPHRPDGIRGQGAAIKGFKFTGVK